MKLNSINSKLLLIISVAFLIFAAATIILASTYFEKIIDTTLDQLYSDKVDAILVRLERNVAELQDTLMVDAYEDQFKNSILAILRKSHYNSERPGVYPFIIDTQGTVVLHPRLERGSTALADEAYTRKIIALKAGTINRVADGVLEWTTFKWFKDWNWIVGYAIALDTKYADSRRFRAILIIFIIALAVVVLITVSAIVTKFTRPITQLTRATAEMSQGNLEQPLNIKRSDEFGVLARSFTDMRNSIQEKIAALAKQNKELQLQITERKRAEDLLDSFFKISVDMLSIASLDGVFRHVNPAFKKTLGYTRDELLANPYHEFVHPDDKDATLEATEKLAKGVPAIKFENRYICKDGTYKWLEWTSMPDPAAGLTYAVARDVTDAKKMAAEKTRMKTLLQEAQKMEAIGTLAGGIAHDFNNLLMGILGTVSLLLATIETTHPDYEKLHNIESYVHQATDLTRQLLGFARGGKYEVKSIDLNRLVNESSRLFGRTRKEVTIHLRLHSKTWAVEADKGQIDQVLLNLYVNAWQSMPEGGQFYISTENLYLDEKFVKPFDVEPGRYVKIALTDTGGGMDEATRQRIFEPFFTTKKMGRGTGLGLATVYGIIKNHGGIIHVYSELDQGTTFSIYLPATSKTVAGDKELPACKPGRRETILLVDDEKMIIGIGQDMLSLLNYNVLVANSGPEALAIFEKQPADIDLVILDMIMPDVSGGETFDRLKAIRQDVKVLLSSGYSLEGKATEIMERGCKSFIQKPFSINQLAQKIREALDTGSPELHT